MKAETLACALPHEKVNWNVIDWRTANRNVRRLQARIVKATQEGRWGKVKALQRLLTHSFSGKVLAVRRVTENQGKRTPGVDGELWNTPAKKTAGIQKLRQRGYRPQPLRREYIPKSNNPAKLRPLGIPTMLDRAMQALYLLALEPVAETTADPNSYGFRKERSTADAIGQCFILLGRKQVSPDWILEGDIKACFDQISHEWLLSHIPMDKSILRKWLKAGYLEKNAFHSTEMGSPQGGIISPVLANMALDGLEKELSQSYRPRSGQPSNGVNMVRYADDWIVTGRSREMLEEQILPHIATFLEERGLELSPEKTRITHISEGFDFLGQNIRKYNGKLIIKPSRKSIKTHLDKVRSFIRANKMATAGGIVTQLNPILRGWANYHRHVCSKSTFGSVDAATFYALWRWAKRRHPNKGARWVKDKYFKTVGNRHWVFTGKVKGREGKPQTVRLISVAYTPIRRHIKVRATANPFDPQWEEYFEERLKKKMANTLQGNRKLLHLWKSQDGRCLHCGLLITPESNWHVHHIVWRSKGGSDNLSNLQILHPTCHQQIHCQR
jgi:RNA-directed DNA polymerase